MRNLVNTTSATATYNTAAIMRQAWHSYDRVNCLGDRKRFKFNRVFFAQMLAATWRKAHKQMATTKLAALPASEKATRCADLEGLLTGLNFLPVGMNANRRATAIKSELATLAA